MRLALIPPISRLEDTHDTDMQLALPHMFYASEVYSKLYKEHLEDNEQYVILDNGAAEDEQPSNEDLCELVVNLWPSEFALPDVLGETDATVARSFHYLLDHGECIPQSTPKAGFVAQGRTIDESCSGVDAILDSAVGHQIKVIYIPRLLLAKSGNKNARLEVAEYLHYKYKDKYEIHLFGASVEWPQEIIEAAKLPFIRSMDTSLPYNYALQGRLITPISAEKFNRLPGYFDREFDTAQGAFADANVVTMEAWADGRI